MEGNAVTERTDDAQILTPAPSVVKDQSDVLAKAMGSLARDLGEHDDPDALLAAIVASAVELVPGAQDGSISMIAARRRVTPHVPTGQLPVQVAAIQEDVQQGPCIDTTYGENLVRVDDLATETRWPQFSSRAVEETGLASALTLKLYVKGGTLGALNLYSTEAHAFDDEAEQIGSIFATHAAIAFAAARKEAQYAEAVASRDVIGQAKGILMERYGIKGDRAFLVLTRASQHANRKLYDVATELVDTRNIAGTTPPPGTSAG